MRGVTFPRLSPAVLEQYPPQSDASTLPSNTSTTSFPVSPTDSPPVTFVIKPNKVPLAVCLTFGILEIATAILGGGIYCPYDLDAGDAVAHASMEGTDQ